MRYPAFLVLALALAGCTEKKPTPSIAKTLPTLLIPPEATVLSREAGEDALKIRFRSLWAPDSVARYYREMLSRAPWNLISDTPMQDGTVALYAERPNGPPLWVTIRKGDGGVGAIVDLAGAQVTGGQ
ncbi:MAG TPA: hypothetical protein VMG41_05540 [Gemmatimonadales bacterium]|nr:hypothetical protein [Gemmatimonadales bacterium]